MDVRRHGGFGQSSEGCAHHPQYLWPDLVEDAARVGGDERHDLDVSGAEAGKFVGSQAKLLVDQPHFFETARGLLRQLAEAEVKACRELKITGNADQVVVVETRQLGIGGPELGEEREQPGIGHRE